jgi:hypothetical protein
MTFMNALSTEMNNTITANGAKAYESTQNECLDLYGSIGACRNNLTLAERLFFAAYEQHPETAVRILFYSRDIRGASQGERAVFRALMPKLAHKNPRIATRLVSLIPYYGRWDDLLCLENTPVWNEVLKTIETQLKTDMSSDKTSLLAKWLPSINASSKYNKRLGRLIAAHMGWSERQYRKNLSSLRAKIKIVETPMCAKEWSVIDYEHLPSRAAFMYRKAFKKHDETRYSDYLSRVEKGEAKINAGTLYPYDIVNKYLFQGARNDKTLELQWNALPNYMEDLEFNGLVVADVSGSMMNNSGMPMAVSISLAMYIAERNPSKIWKNKFLTFSQAPKLQTILGNNIEEKIRYLQGAEWGMNTDLIAVFNTILKAATENNVAAKDMPQKLIIVSDMQFDVACRSNKRTNFEQIQKMYRKSGYEMPQLIFWNVNASANVPIQADDTGTALVSGCSPAILKSVLSGKIVSPVDVMMDSLYVERYAPIGEVFA